VLILLWGSLDKYTFSGLTAKQKGVKSFRFGNIPIWKDYSMSIEKNAEQFIEIIQKFICLRPKMILPEHVVQLKKKMEAMKSSGFSSGDHAFVFRVLILLSQTHEPLTMSKLSTELNVPMSTATRIVDWLVDSGMVERVNDPNDRRVVRVNISKNGQEMYETGLIHNRERISRLLKDFTFEEQTQLLHLMEKLFNSLLKETNK
jgi:DNA-binding MarR family transcriptional regulator